MQQLATISLGLAEIRARAVPLLAYRPATMIGHG